MKPGIREFLRLFVARNIVADDPYPGRSWLDEQDMLAHSRTAPSPAATENPPTASPLSHAEATRRFSHRAPGAGSCHRAAARHNSAADRKNRA
jgi:hypothetical protein